MSEKIPLVLFSGGLDSTAMLWKYLQDGPVDVLYADGGQHPLKIEKELECRKRTIEYLNRVSPHKVQMDLRTDNNVSFASGPTSKYSQPMAWMVAAMSVLDTSRHKCLAVGYVGDDGGFLRYIPNIYTAWENMQILTKTGEPVPIVFPIIDNRKVDLLNAIPTELLDSIWVCEMPRTDDNGVIRPCKSCSPCKLAAAVLHQFEQENGYTIFSKKLVKQLRAVEDEYRCPWMGRDMIAHQSRRVADDWCKDSSDYWYRHPKKVTEPDDDLKLTDSI